MLIEVMYGDGERYALALRDGRECSADDPVCAALAGCAGVESEADEEPGQFWKDFIRETAPVFRKPTIDQLSEFIEPTWQALCDGSRYVDDRLRESFDEVRPDAIVEDNVICFPAIHHSGRPWARIVSCNPLELKDDAVAPVFSGYAADDTTGWDEFRTEYSRAIAGLHAESSAFCSVPLADVVITHAGNNTTTECFHFGKPMVALPLFWDQYDNGQRVQETGFGIRLPTYEFEEADLLDALDRLLADAELGARMSAIAARKSGRHAEPRRPPA
jgi:UDP:flavonoid glycosyltransferase YjiC (YdhE family)